MRIRILYIIIFGFISLGGYSQVDSLKAVIAGAEDDSNKVNSLIALSGLVSRSAPDEAVTYGLEAKDLAEKIGFSRGEAYALKSIGMGHYFSGEYIETLVYWQQSLDLFISMGDDQGISNMLNNLGAVNFNNGDDAKALEYYLESLRVAEKINDSLRIVTALVNIGAVYFNKKATHDLALKYYLRALPLSEKLGNQDAIGTSAVNMGEIYLDKKDDRQAMFYFEKALEAFRKTTNGNVPYALNNVGKTYLLRGDFDQAIYFQREAYRIAAGNGAKLEMAQALLGLAATNEEQGDINAAIEAFKDAKEIAAGIQANYELKFAYEGLAQAYEQMGDYRNAYTYGKLYTEIKDTLYNAEMDKKLRSVILDFEVESKQRQIDLLTKDKELQQLDLRRQKTIRNATAITGALILLLALGLFSRYRYVRRTKKIIEDEKARSDKLLLNILPEETAEELKQKGSATPKHYDLVSVLFTDFKGFTKIAEKLTPQELVHELNQCFMEFDSIIDKYNLEKIKTIGDAYMCAGGIPVANKTNPVDIVKAGIEIKEYMENLKKEREARGEDYWELRIGIHTGPVIAGVVGSNKFAYDIWGDAVNTASRMESSGIPGKVNISGATYELIKDYFECTYRGKIQAKNKGEIDMYIVEGIKLQGKEIIPVPELVEVI